MAKLMLLCRGERQQDSAILIVAPQSRHSVFGHGFLSIITLLGDARSRIGLPLGGATSTYKINNANKKTIPIPLHERGTRWTGPELGGKL
jgi:hypothetical protein